MTTTEAALREALGALNLLVQYEYLTIATLDGDVDARSAAICAFQKGVAAQHNLTMAIRALSQPPASSPVAQEDAVELVRQMTEAFYCEVKSCSSDCHDNIGFAHWLIEKGYLSPSSGEPARRSTSAERAKAVEAGRKLDAEDGGYPEPASVAANIGPRPWMVRITPGEFGDRISIRDASGKTVATMQPNGGRKLPNAQAIVEAVNALSPPASVAGEAREALERSRATAMEYAVQASIPWCGKFGEIAQDLDAALYALSKPTPVEAGQDSPERKPIPLLNVLNSEVRGEDGLRESIIHGLHSQGWSRIEAEQEADNHLTPSSQEE